MASGSATALLDAAGIPNALPPGEPDPGLLTVDDGATDAAELFVAALARHRHFERETDPPIV